MNIFDSHLGLIFFHILENVSFWSIYYKVLSSFLCATQTLPKITGKEFVIGIVTTWDLGKPQSQSQGWLVQYRDWVTRMLSLRQQLFTIAERIGLDAGVHCVLSHQNCGSMSAHLMKWSENSSDPQMKSKQSRRYRIRSLKLQILAMLSSQSNPFLLSPYYLGDIYSKISTQKTTQTQA